jgi:pyruvate/2-oxoglutarate dehydrogenase complex dihydrolipoamide dehydrogenase (E3) component
MAAQAHDLIVIGMGVGGEEVAGRAAEAGMDVVAVERKLVGGECPYWGCIPSKIMVRAGNALAEAARVAGLAGRATVAPDWAPVAARVREVTAGWDDRVAVERFEKKGGTFVRGEARVVAPGEAEVDGRRLRARRGIVLATGGEPSVPPIDGLELAQTFRRFGVETTVVEAAGHPLPGEEPENGEAMAEVLEAEGIALHVGTPARAVRPATGGAGVAVELADGTVVEAERLLVATGRRSDLRRLGLDAVGLDPAARAVQVDEHLRAGGGLWAVGDVTGRGAFTHLAVYQGRIAAADVLGRQHAPADYRAVPRVTFTDPEVAGVGLTEAAARDAGIAVRTGVARTASSARGWIHGPGAEHGVVKLVADGDREVLVGASVMGPAAGEVIGLLLLAVKERVPLPALRQLIYPYPTFVRGLEDALRQLH